MTDGKAILLKVIGLLLTVTYKGIDDKHYEILDMRMKQGGPAELKHRLILAEMGQTLLASLILMWHCGRTESIRKLVVNNDIYRTLVDGRNQVLIDPVQDLVFTPQ